MANVKPTDKVPEGKTPYYVTRQMKPNKKGTEKHTQRKKIDL